MALDRRGENELFTLRVANQKARFDLYHYRGNGLFGGSPGDFLGGGLYLDGYPDPVVYFSFLIEGYSKTESCLDIGDVQISREPEYFSFGYGVSLGARVLWETINDKAYHRLADFLVILDHEGGLAR